MGGAMPCSSEGGGKITASSDTTMVIACSTHQANGASRPTGFQSYQKIGGDGQPNNSGTRGATLLNHGSGSHRNVIYFYEGRVTKGRTPSVAARGGPAVFS